MYEVTIENEACVIQCEIIDLVVEEPRPGLWTSDWDAQGYRELEFRAVSGKWFDADGSEHDLGRNGCAEVADRYAEYIEQQLWEQIDAEAAST
ncbi:MULTISPECIES: hypothetical protein [unclassified Pseudomonas]|uniref:hypothetical protein n=1 Tax=unclassified Pseudomonas TaxID=196821 RepID=UPI000A1D99F0|nr:MULTISPECIES: hypothetical protein [unclassified Pseudomonas]